MTADIATDAAREAAAAELTHYLGQVASLLRAIEAESAAVANQLRVLRAHTARAEALARMLGPVPAPYGLESVVGGILNDFPGKGPKGGE